MTTDDVRQYVRYRNYAEELRVLASEKSRDPARQRALYMAANEYDLMAESMQTIIDSRRVLKD